MASENVKVAVRLRPFNGREKDRNASLIIGMDGSTTTIQDPANPDKAPHKFNFDYSYWSHDGCQTEENGYISMDPNHPNRSKYADQKKVFDDLGVGILQNAWQGYNSTLFAYGQTGSGKSWSIVGYDINKGIVPQFCERLFEEIEQKKAEPDNVDEYQVLCSMLEIYNEKVSDLLISNTKMKENYLKVCLHPSLGFYAKGLQHIPVKNYEKIKKLMDMGTTNRTVAATNMNATSSRAHTIFGITFTQKYKNASGSLSEKTAIINLVDLAGSERVKNTGATGSRLKEGASINKSLFSLGNCIAALSDGNEQVPYRNSELTKLLKSALGGNSKTIMIAAVSPADINYAESLSTLRYANRAKQIKTSAKVNECETDILIRKMTEEIEQYKMLLKSGNIPMTKDNDNMTEEEKNAMRKEIEDEYTSLLEENKQKINDMNKTYAERLKEAEERANQPNEARAAIDIKKKTIPYLYNLNMDPQLTGHIFYFLAVSPIIVGKQKEENGIFLTGPSIVDKHAVFSEESGKWNMEPGTANVRVLVNGVPITSKTQLNHNDRLVFGTTQYYVFTHQKERDENKQTFPVVTFEMAQEEIGTNSGIDMNFLLQEDLLEMLPAIEDVNAISKVLERKKKFSLKLSSKSEVRVLVVDTETEIEWIWTRQDFLNRKYIMQEVYQRFVNGEEWNLPQDQDPFYDDPTAPFMIGSAEVYLKSLAYNIESQQQLDIIDCSAHKSGTIEVHLIPCDAKEKEYSESDECCYSEPEELINKDMHFKIKINQARGLPNRFTDMYACFQFYLDDIILKTEALSDTINPNWTFSKMFSFQTVTKQLIDYLSLETIEVQVWGSHKQGKKDKSKNFISTKELKSSTPEKVTEPNSRELHTEKAKHLIELHILKKRQSKLQIQMNSMKQMIEIAEKNSKKKLSVDLIKKIFNSNSIEQSEANLQLIIQEKDDSNDEDNSSESSPSSSSSPSTATIPSTPKDNPIKKPIAPSAGSSSACNII